MENQILIDEKVIAAFHLIWDSFPGSVRLIHKSHIVLAANPVAQKLGFEEGVKCVCIGPQESHKGCKSGKMLKTQTAQLDHISAEKIRGWLPLEGYDEIYVHFTLPVPE